jgi:site-specific DNA recombinase
MKTSKTAKAAVRCIGYIRVSTEGQAEEGVSLAQQEKAIRAYCDLYGVELLAIEVDAGLSAKTLSRPALQRAMARIEAGEADGLVVAKLDRLTRSVRDLGDLIEGPFSTAVLLSVAEQIDTRSAGGRLVLNVLASVSQWEREVIAERTTAAMQELRATKQYTGGVVRYGYRVGDDGALVPVDHEQQTIALAQELRAKGMSLRAVSAELTRAGRTSRNGKTFAAKQVAFMIAATQSA